jgi:hypothetical protein
LVLVELAGPGLEAAVLPEWPANAAWEMVGSSSSSSSAGASGGSGQAGGGLPHWLLCKDRGSGKVLGVFELQLQLHPLANSAWGRHSGVGFGSETFVRRFPVAQAEVAEVAAAKAAAAAMAAAGGGGSDAEAVAAAAAAAAAAALPRAGLLCAGALLPSGEVQGGLSTSFLLLKHFVCLSPFGVRFARGASQINLSYSSSSSSSSFFFFFVFV